MDVKVVNGYEIAGNKEVAIAISIDDPKDAHFFTRDPEVHDDAFKRAVAWAAPGL